MADIDDDMTPDAGDDDESGPPGLPNRLMGALKGATRGLQGSQQDYRLGQLGNRAPQNTALLPALGKAAGGFIGGAIRPPGAVSSTVPGAAVPPAGTIPGSTVPLGAGPNAPPISSPGQLADQASAIPQMAAGGAVAPAPTYGGFGRPSMGGQGQPMGMGRYQPRPAMGPAPGALAGVQQSAGGQGGPQQGGPAPALGGYSGGPLPGQGGYGGMQSPQGLGGLGAQGMSAGLPGGNAAQMAATQQALASRAASQQNNASFLGGSQGAQQGMYGGAGVGGGYMNQGALQNISMQSAGGPGGPQQYQPPQQQYQPPQPQPAPAPQPASPSMSGMYGSGGTIGAGALAPMQGGAGKPPGMARGGIALGPAEPQQDPGTPGTTFQQPGSVMRRYEPTSPIGPHVSMGPKPEDMGHHLPTRLPIGHRMQVRLPRPKMSGMGGISGGR